MRYNPDKKCTMYFEWPNPWDIKPWFQECPKKKKKPRVPKPWEVDENEIGKQKTILFWRDLEKAGQIITEKDLYFENWPKNNRKDPRETWLPPQMCHAGRFIKLTMGFPLGWRYRDMPMSLKEVREVNKAEAEKRKAEAKNKKKKNKKNVVDGEKKDGKGDKKGEKGGKKGEKEGKKEGEKEGKKGGEKEVKKEDKKEGKKEDIKDKKDSKKVTIRSSK